MKISVFTEDGSTVRCGHNLCTTYQSWAQQDFLKVPSSICSVPNAVGLRPGGVAASHQVLLPPKCDVPQVRRCLIG